MTEIKIIKSIAQRRIETHIYEGQRLSERLTYDNLPEMKDEYDRWSKNVLSDLSRMFSDKSLANEFQDASVIPFDENDSHVDEKNRLVDYCSCALFSKRRHRSIRHS